MDLRYPIGKFDWFAPVDPAIRPQCIAAIAEAPGRFREAVRGLDQLQLDTPYRQAGWTVRQVVHHVPDSHMNCFIRFRLALTEDEPLIKPYDEGKWAQLHDSRTAPVELCYSSWKPFTAAGLTSWKPCPAAISSGNFATPRLACSA